MTIIDRALSVVGLQRKADDLPILTYQQQALWWPTWAWGASTLTPATWQTLTPLTLAEYYMTNPVVHACVRVYAESFSQARLKTYNSKDGEEIPNHPLTRLFQRPNELMGQSEFWRYVAAYILYGGNGYAHLLPSVAGGKRGVAEMWPYNVNQMVPIPSMQKWVDHYAYNLGNGDWKDVPSQEVVHVKWAVDPNRPWLGFAPVTPAAHDVDTHTEFTRLRKVILQNDAMPLTAVKIPPDQPPLTPKQRQEVRDDFRRLHGGPNFGKMALLERGADIVRMALNFDELQASELMASLEANICASFGIHPIIARVKIGLDKSTYSNYEEAVRDFTKTNLVPLWESVASEFTNSLQYYYGDGWELGFDYSEIAALQEDQNALETRAADSLNKGLRTLNETRRLIGEPDVEGGDVWFIPHSITLAYDLQEEEEEQPSEANEPAGAEEPPDQGSPAETEEPGQSPAADETGEDVPAIGEMMAGMGKSMAVLLDDAVDTLRPRRNGHA